MSLTPEQLAARQTGLGGSDAGAIAEVNPYAGPFDVWARFHLPGVPRPEFGEPALWGNALEGAIADEYARRFGVTLEAPQTTFRHPEHHWMIGNVDRIAPGGRLVEIKTAGFRQAHRWGDEGTDEIPEEYRLQVVHYLAVLGLDRADLAVLIGGQDFRVYHFERDREMEALLVAAEREFWERHVVTGAQPSLGDRESAHEWLKRLHPRATLPEVEPTDPMVAAAMAYNQARAHVDAAEAAKTQTRVALEELIGDSAGFRWGRKSKATWTNNRDAPETDWESVVRDLEAPADVIARHTRIKQGARVLRVTVKE